jgi:hypothetical protein
VISQWSCKCLPNLYYKFRKNNKIKLKEKFVENARKEHPRFLGKAVEISIKI